MTSLLNNVFETVEQDWQLDYWTKPVLFKEFVTSKEHLNLVPLSPKQYDAIFQLIGEDPLKVFSMDRKKHVGVFLWGKGCLAGDTILKDEKTGIEYTILSLYQNQQTILIKSFDTTTRLYVNRTTGIPFIKGEDEVFQVTLVNGLSITVAAEHVFLTNDGWKPLSQLDTTSQIFTESYNYVTIQSIVSQGVQYYYDLDVPQFHCFFSQGILNHNSGKDYATSVMIAYLLYLLLCMKDPHQMFGFPHEENIDILNVAPTARQARKIFFAKLTARISNWPWLMNNFEVSRRGKVLKNSTGQRMKVRITDDAIETENNIRCISMHSEAGNFEGFNVLCATLDEISEFPQDMEAMAGEEEMVDLGKAEFIYNTLKSSAVSRKLPWIMVLISFPRMQDDWLIRKYEEAIAEKDNPETMYVPVRGCTWEFNPRYEGEKTFRFEKWDIPLTFKSSFEKNPKDSKLKFCTEPPETINAFFYNPQRIYDAIDDSITNLIELAEGTDEFLDSNNKKVTYLVQRVVSTRIVDKKRPFAIHVDLSIIKDTTTLVIGHGEPCEGYMLSVLDASGKQVVKQINTKVVIDQIVIWEPNKKKNIMVSSMNVEEIAKNLIGLTGLRYISYDQFQSQYLLEAAMRSGIDSEKINIKDKHYILFRNVLHAGGVSFPRHPKLILEMEKLSFDGRRVDHLPQYSKDCCDSVAGVISAIIEGKAKAVEEFNFVFGGPELFMGEDTYAAVNQVKLPDEAIPNSQEFLNFNMWA
jgi:hypothetical protein